MIGPVKIIVYDSKLQYNFTLRRNITVLRDKGASGKTTLMRMVERAQVSSSGTKIVSNVRVLPLTNAVWNAGWDGTNVKQDTVFILDESCTFMKSIDFAKAAQISGCYFVLITRDSLPSLPCSIHEIYSLHTSGGIVSFVPEYEETHYGDCMQEFNTILTEDSNSGFQFMQQVFPEAKVISAGGNSNISKVLHTLNEDCVLVFADGAALGFYMDYILQDFANRSRALIAMESFEYVLLTSKIFSSRIKELQILEPVIDSKQYFSWERYFTKTLEDLTKNTVLEYSKIRLNSAYLQKRNQIYILERYGLLHFKSRSAFKTEITDIFNNK